MEMDVGGFDVFFTFYKEAFKRSKAFYGDLWQSVALLDHEKTTSRHVDSKALNRYPKFDIIR